jgi:phage tail-like protein
VAAQSSTVDPFLVTKFWVEIAGVAEGVFQECSGLSVETEVLEYPEGGVNNHVHRLPGRTKYSNVTLKRGWTQSDELWKWYAKIVAGDIERKAVSIILFENKGANAGKEKARWNLDLAYPIKWQGPDFRAESNTIAVETLVLAHSGWQAAYA